MARVFISHSSRDDESAARLKAWLAEQGFETPFLDFDKHSGIPPGADWEKNLYREIERAEAVVIVQTPNWLESKWCFAEFTQARALGKAIFPVIEAPTGETLIAPDIQSLDLLADRSGGLERLDRELRQIALDAQSGFGWDSSRAPYPGLAAFQEEDAALYFGRDDDIRRLIQVLTVRRTQGGCKLIALLGASGSGKSSLLRAGVLPRLKRDAKNWIVLPPMRPQIHPIDELARVFAVALDQGATWRTWHERLNASDAADALGELAADLRAQTGANEAMILLTVDQAEELFDSSEQQEADRFFELINLIQQHELPYLVVLAQRSDHLDKLQSAEHLTIRFEEFSLAPLPLDRIPQIIEGPARVAGLSIDDSLVMQAARDAGTEDALPLLAFALRELYDRFGDDNHLSLADYQALGDAKAGLTPLENAVRKAADKVLEEARPDRDDLLALRDAFVPAMVHVNDNGDYARHPALWDALPARAQPLLERLVRARLLVKRGDGDAIRVEVAHEALLRKWPRLRVWLDEAREFLHGKQQLQSDLKDWEIAASEDKTGTLLSGLKLNRAQGWLLERPQQLSEQERALIQASIDQAQAEQERKLRDAEALVAANRKTVRNTRWGLMVSLVLLVLAGGAAFYANEQTIRAEQTSDEALLSQSKFLTDLSHQEAEESNYVKAMLLALEALPDSTSEDPSRRQRPFWSEAEMALEFANRNRNEDAVFRGHQDWISSVAISPDGAYLVTGSADKTARIWDIQADTEHALLRGHQSFIYSAAFSPDGTWLVTGSWDRTARIWDAQTGEEQRVLRGHEQPVQSVAISSDGNRIVTGSWDGTARIWDTVTGKEQVMLGGEEIPVSSVAISDDGAYVLTGLVDNKAILWDIETGKEHARLLGHEGMITSVAFSPDGDWVVTGSADGNARLWDTLTGDERRVLRGHDQGINSVAVSPDGAWVVTGSKDESARLWDVQTGAEKAVLRGHDQGISSVTISPDGDWVATGSMDRTARTWDTQTERGVLRGHEGTISSMAFAPDGSYIVTGSADHTARIWNTRTGIEQMVLNGHQHPVFSVAVSPDGASVVTGSKDRTARLWDAQTGEERAVLEGHTSDITSMAFAPDSSFVLTGSDDNTARIWETGTGAERTVLQGHKRDITSMAIAPDGTWVVTGSKDKTARLWDAQTGEERMVLGGHSERISSVAISPDGAWVLTGSDDHTARIWDTGTGTERAVLRGHDVFITSIAISPDGAWVLTGSGDGTARLWDAQTGTERRVLRGHEGIIWSVAMSPDGVWVVTGSQDGSARLWDVDTGSERMILGGNDGSVYSVAISPDGTAVVTGSGDGTARLWQVTTNVQALVDLAKEQVSRCLSPTEREDANLAAEPPDWCMDKWPYQQQSSANPEQAAE